MAEINEEIRTTTYKGHERIDEIVKKWELIGTHTGRRTFIIHALSRGILPSIVMRWTGDSEMTKMNFMEQFYESLQISKKCVYLQHNRRIAERLR